ncbi:MAG: ABC transporter ATP-binding protein [Roseovarius sp.]|nr:ABC transporter ATP-binding protein [Roseovarius sp.]MCY4290562.1 ABC transporter ATP-binding protein [Roseovarius sp.]
MFKFFENLVDPYCEYEQTDRPPTRLWPFLMAYTTPFRSVFRLTAIMSVIVAAVEIWLIYYMGRLIDLLSGDPATFWREHGTELVLVAAFILFARPVVQAVDVLLLNNTILTNFGTLIRWRAHRQVLRQSVEWFENDFAGRIANRIMQTPPAAGEAVFEVFDAITFSIAYIVAAVIMLSEADTRLALPLLLWLSAYAALVRWTLRRVGKASKLASDARSLVTGRVVDAYTNIDTVKLFACDEREILYARKAIEYSRKTFQLEMRIYTIMDVVLVTLNGFLVVGVVGWAVYLWAQGQASVGVVAAATALTLRLNAMTGWIMWALTSLFRNLGVVAEGMETIARPIALTDRPGAKTLELRGGEIEFENVSHHYGGGRNGLENVSFRVKSGEKIGLVGKSGAGKSTLVKLLLRFYDAEHGRILVDGQDISAVAQNSLRDKFGMVQQDSSLLHRTIRENILYGMPDASEEKMIEAARKAGAHGFIRELRDPSGMTGYYAQVGERGVKLSGGQRQRIALARALLKDAPIMLLDEATSALDSEIEAEIQETLYGMMHGKTVIAIAHRLSTIARMDRILVLDKGRIIEEGSHDELLAQGMLYSRFWSRQSGGFLGSLDVDGGKKTAAG